MTVEFNFEVTDEIEELADTFATTLHAVGEGFGDDAIHATLVLAVRAITIGQAMGFVKPE